jgi:hypothetical protein
MKTALSFLGLLLWASSFVVARQQRHGIESCGFTVQGEPTEPTVTGPDGIVPLVCVVEQPDSPIEIVTVDLQGMCLSVLNGQHDERDCAKYKVRSQSDRTVQHFELMLRLSTMAGGRGSGALSTSLLSPGESIEIQACGVAGHGGAPDNHVRLLVYVESADFKECRYRPSLRIPRSLGVSVF